MKSLLTASVVLASFATAGQAMDIRPAMQGFVESSVLPWAQDPVLIDAIVAQNIRTSGLGEAEILELDQQWRAQVGFGDAPLVDSVVGNSASDFLRTHASLSAGMISEVFVMDALGLNVASSGFTSDYWQGDEAKFIETYSVGPDAMHYGEVEFDESSQSFQSQVSFTIVDPATGQPIGAMTVGINAEAFM